LFLSGDIKYVKDFQTGLPKFSDGSIIWPLSSDKPGEKAFIYYTEELKETTNEKLRDGDNTSYYILPLNAVDEFSYQFPERSFEIFKYIDNIEE
jgi:hypothetical protein